jgi:hypothetical protein
MHEFTLYLSVIVVTCLCCLKTPTNEPMFSSRLRIVNMNICLYVYIFFKYIYVYRKRVMLHTTMCIISIAIIAFQF